MSLDQVEYFVSHLSDLSLDEKVFHLRSFEENQKEFLIHAVRVISALKPKREYPQVLLDTCGTGGSGQSRLNTSTLTAFLLAKQGKSVLKFGGRSSSSPVGSIDFLETLGMGHVATDLDLSLKTYQSKGLSFLFAGAVYPFLKDLRDARKVMGKKSLVNDLAPLLHPCFVEKRLLGVTKIHPWYLEVLQELKISACLVSSKSGIDEAVPFESTLCLSQANENTIGIEDLKETDAWIKSKYPHVIAEQFLSKDPVKDGQAVLRGKGSQAHQVLVAYNGAIALKFMGADGCVPEIVARLMDSILSGELTVIQKD